MTVAHYEEDIPGAGVRVKAMLTHAGEYAVAVFAVSPGGLAKPIPGGAAMLPPEIIQSVKEKLWQTLKPT